MANWKNLIKYVSEGDQIISCTLTEKELLKDFYNGYGSEEGKPFTAWSNEWVYFPVCYDGSECVGRAPRNPCDKSTEHVGG